MVSIDTLRKLALSFPEATEEPHFEKISFRRVSASERLLGFAHIGAAQKFTFCTPFIFAIAS